MADDGRGIVLALLIGVGLSGFFLVVAALFPRVVSNSKRTAERSPGRSLLVGLVNIFFLGALGLGFSSLAENSGIGLFQLIAVIVFSLVAILLAYGLTAVTQLVGGRLIPQAHPVWQHILGGWVVLLGGLTPFIGWFLLTPYLAMVATGSVLLGWVRFRRRTEALSSEAAPDNLD